MLELHTSFPVSDPVYDTARRPEHNEHNYMDIALGESKSQPTAGS